MDRDPQGGSDVGRDYERDLGDEPAPRSATARPTTSRRSTPSAPVSGHLPAPGIQSSPADAPEQDWARARGPPLSGIPTGRDAGSAARLASTARRWPRTAAQSHAQPLLDEGPAELPVVYTLDAGAYDIVVNGDHLLAWGVEPPRSRTPRSATSPPGRQRRLDRRVVGRAALISSDTGNGWDAARILLPEVVDPPRHRARVVRPDPHRAPGTAPGRPAAAAGRRGLRERSSPTSSSSTPAAPTSRSTDGSSSWSTAGWSVRRRLSGTPVASERNGVHRRDEDPLRGRGRPSRRHVDIPRRSTP